nr:restriction endonuclease subunit S [Leptospira interrogans]
MGDILTIQKGKKHSIAHDITTSSTRLLQIEDLRNDNQLKYTNDTNGVLATEEDLMIVWDGANAGTVGYGKRGFIGSTISVLKKKDQDSFDTRFLGKFLQSQFSMLRKKTSGTTIPHIDRSILENIFIPVLNLSDQIHIAHILSQAEALIAQRKESIRLLDELVKSKFLEMFGDPVKNDEFKLSEICIKITDGTHDTPERLKEGIKFITGKHIREAFIDYDNSDYVTEEIHKEIYRRCNPEYGDILYTNIGVNLGTAAMNTVHYQFSMKNVALLKLRKNRISPRYIEKYLNYFREKIINDNSAGGAQRFLSLSQINSIKIYLPNFQVQYQFEDFVEKIELQKVRMRKSLKDLETLYSSLSQKAFNGELMINQKSSSKVSTPRITPETSLHVIATDSNKERTTLQKVDKAKSTLISKKEEQSFLKRKILGSYIINQSLEDSQFGDVKFEKLLHLSEYLILKRNFGQHYVQKVAGPYDNKFTILFFQQIEKDRWFRRTKKEKQFHFQKGEKHESSTKAYNYFSEQELGFVQSLIQLFKKANYEKVEVVSTLYAVWNNRIIKGEPIEDNLLKEDFLNWDLQKTKYKDRLDKALAWMREKNLVPDGWGPLIEKTK